RFSSALSVSVLGLAVAAGPRSGAVAAADLTPSLQAATADYAKGDSQSAWFRFWTLAQKGDAPAPFNLGQLYRLGQGIPVDLARARYWYQEAAARGNGQAQYNLGVMYENGHGVPEDPTEARAWFRRAAAQNVPGAQEALQRLERRPRTP